MLVNVCSEKSGTSLLLGFRLCLCLICGWDTVAHCYLWKSKILWFTECHPMLQLHLGTCVCQEPCQVFPQLQKYIVFLPIPISVIMAVFAHLRKETVVVLNARDIWGKCWEVCPTWQIWNKKQPFSSDPELSVFLGEWFWKIHPGVMVL